ncbi:TetR/AcrR family transcriptional regulator [Microbacterium sp. H83]|uniref:TetR/AcrR family transcriptional regulator n=1 Tax=Microbacterium sp. H83 TaxID=1827324 RepID=UPI0007F4ED37|nr:helix-turn-helix domain-containing protein [Microbacterium sp. H83]OAN33919.1 TetR family transcriptional regulator [Microbacterium sp. H83]
MSLAAPDLSSLTPGARRVLDAASTLFYERGIHAVGVDTIAELAGVTKKTLYDRFGSKEALVIAYLQHRDARWREHLDACLAAAPPEGSERVLTVFDAALSWSDANSPKGCSAINARAELGDGADGRAVLLEVQRQTAWLLDLFTELCASAGLREPQQTAQAMMLLYEGAIVTVGMATFPAPFVTARACAATLLESARGDA